MPLKRVLGVSVLAVGVGVAALTAGVGLASAQPGLRQLGALVPGVWIPL